MAIRLVAALAVTAGLTRAAPVSGSPMALAVQGRLSASGGGAVADGNYPLAFKLYEAATGGDPLWSEFHLAVAVQGGVLGAELGSVDGNNPLDDGMFTSGKAKWLGVTVGGEPELPRVGLRPVPFAIHAVRAGVAAGLQCSGCVAAGQIAAQAITSEKLAPGAVLAAHVAFSFAGSDEKGGAAKSALIAEAAKVSEFAKSADTAKVADVAKNADKAATADEAGFAKNADTAKNADNAKKALSLQCTGCVGAPELAAKGVTGAKLADGAVDSVHLSKDLTLQGKTSFQGNVGIAGDLSVLGAKGTATLASDRQLQHVRLENGAGPPYKCSADEIGGIYYDTKQKAVFLCDGTDWASVAQVATCSDPNADLTNATYPHYGSGNCSPYGNDQTWMSKNDAYASAQYGWHDSCGKTGPESWCAIQYPAPTRVVRYRVLLHTNPPKQCVFQGGNDSSNGQNGNWVTLQGPIDFPSGQEGQWSQYHTFQNTNTYKLYRLYCPGTPSHALYEWEMFCG
ncbi:MAG: hypothetical protein EXR79_10705 [Myxococcales bacterium]|nr:hypothetical protein [Myxococcales bacterium]